MYLYKGLVVQYFFSKVITITPEGNGIALYAPMSENTVYEVFLC
ncbi:hypothetical protein THERMOS_1473 [Bathymodiolus thermophilus thioautotrophic gill symbiont]|uniref:Uncharacterized protein n=1 Tax=Bathymodiolus thermophilus thioautotrophic gill symbiont TaxID=2360 RepID=A0A8H8XER2_9GAMM|nr:hypothetical protein THERMOS_1473 [Bathymodiolus thermophilus thioautotrophic gill symbiont]